MIYSIYEIEPVAMQESPASSTQRNAFTVMMSAAKELKFPSKVFSTPERYEVGRGDHRLHDDVVDFLKQKCLGFSPGTENTTGKQVTKSSSDALFYLQPHLMTLSGRISNFVPTYFSCILSGNVYNNPQLHRHAVPPIKRESLDKISDPLYSLMMLPLMQSSKWNEFSIAIKALVTNIQKYKEYLQQQAEKMQEAHRSPTPVRSICDSKSTHVKFIPEVSIRKPYLISRYDTLEKNYYH
jgi:hypothetical protein